MLYIKQKENLLPFHPNNNCEREIINSTHKVRVNIFRSTTFHIYLRDGDKTDRQTEFAFLPIHQPQ